MNKQKRIVDPNHISLVPEVDPNDYGIYSNFLTVLHNYTLEKMKSDYFIQLCIVNMKLIQCGVYYSC